MTSIHGRILATRDTTEHWNAKRSFIPMRGEIIIYTDKTQKDDGFGNVINIPGVKIGDGSAYLIDLPFVGDDERFEILSELRAHTNDRASHVSPEDRAFWNNKLNYEIQGGNLILTRS